MVKTLRNTAEGGESAFRKDEWIKKRIIQAAFGQFSQYGIKSISMDAIARSISISKRTIYDYFCDKEELLSEGIDYYGRKRTERLARVCKDADSALEALLAFYAQVMENPCWYSRKFYDDLQKFPQAMHRLEKEKSTFAAECLRLFGEGVKEGSFLKEVNYEIVSLIIKDNPVMLRPSDVYTNYSAVEVYDTILFTFLRGCCTNTGRTRLDVFVAARRPGRTEL